MVVTLARWTIDEYHQMIAAGILADRHVELLDGEIVEMPSEGTPHAYLGDAGADYLREVFGNRAKIREGHPITLPNHSEPEPDVAIVQPLGEIYLEHHPYVENIFWLIEYADASLSKDLNAKQKIYAAAGIPEYWVINLQKSELIVMRQPSLTGYQSRQIFITGSIRSIAFPDVESAVERLLQG